MGIKLPGPMVLHGDNQAAQHLATNRAENARTKHIDVAYHYIRQQVEHEVIRLEYVSTDWNVADIFTKALPEVKLTRFRDLMGLQ